MSIRREPQEESGCVLITGGAGFVGSNLASRLLTNGNAVRIYDNLSRSGSERNLRWLRSTFGEQLEVCIADVRDTGRLKEAVDGSSRVFHLAAQVAVTTSIRNPIEDFEVNLHGTMNLLEAIRVQNKPPSLVFTSTNKVYGKLGDIGLRKNSSRYEPADRCVLRNGIGEDCPLDFQSPYGCSKGGADQYVLDYARTYGIPAAVFRMSCIYGPHQFGNEDQGWVAHFLIHALKNEPIMIYGDGLQVRDVLYVDDLLNAFELASENIHELAGEAFSIGGGPANTLSLKELLCLIGKLNGHIPEINYAPWRTGDQKYYVSDTSKFASATGWKPYVNVDDGIARLNKWLFESQTQTYESIQEKVA